MTGAAGARLDGQLWYREVGDGPLVALVHGAMDRSGSMLRVQRALPDHRVLRYDRRGYARSLAARPPVSFDQQVDDLASLLHGRPAVLAGHSFGGVVGLALAERRPELIRAVVAYEAPMTWEPWWPESSPGAAALAGARLRTTDTAVGGKRGPGGDHGDAAEWFLRRLIGDQRWEHLPAHVRAERRSEGATLVAELRSVQPPASPPYTPRNIEVPVVAAFGTGSRPHHMRAAGELARQVPHGRLESIEGADHGAHLTHPAEFAALIRTAERLAADGAQV